MEAVLGRILTLPCLGILTFAEAWILYKTPPDQLQALVGRLCDSGLTFSGLLLISLVANTITFVLFKNFIYFPYISSIGSFPSPRSRSTIFGFFQANFSRHRGDHFLRWTSDPCNVEGVVRFQSVLGNDIVVATGPKALQEILATNTYDWEKGPEVRGFLRHILGDGLIIVEGEQHKFQRKHINPAFGFRQIKALYPMMWEKATLAADTIRECIDTTQSNSVEIGSWASKATLDIIGVAGLGREFNTLKNSDDPLVRDYETLLNPDFERGLYFLSRTLIRDGIVQKLPWRMNTIFAETTGSLKRITRRLVQDKRKLMKAGIDEHFDILSLLINSGDFSDDELSDQLLTFLGAGHETTSSALTWTVFLLAKYPTIQALVREEFRAAISSNQDISSLDIATILESLPLLNGVANETLRLYPTVPSTMRVATRPTTLLGRSIPIGTEVLLLPWCTNRLADLWGPDANDFVPQRWIKDGKPNNSGGVDSNYAFLTFLHGPRSCIGQNFARAELRCLIAALVDQFEWVLDQPIDDVIPAGVITIKPKGGLKVKLTPTKYLVRR